MTPVRGGHGATHRKETMTNDDLFRLSARAERSADHGRRPFPAITIPRVMRSQQDPAYGRPDRGRGRGVASQSITRGDRHVANRTAGERCGGERSLREVRGCGVPPGCSSTIG